MTTLIGTHWIIESQTLGKRRALKMVKINLKALEIQVELLEYIIINKQKKWASKICVNYKTIYLGEFLNKDDAIKVRLEAEVKYFKEFAPQKDLFEEYGIKYEGCDINEP